MNSGEGPGAADAEKALSARCMSGPYMRTGARRLLPYLGKHVLGEQVLELGPNRHPLVTPDMCAGRIVYLEISDPCIQFLREEFGESVTIVRFDLNEAWGAGDNVLRRHLSRALYGDSANAVSFDSVVMSQVVNYVDYRRLLHACAEMLRVDGLVFFNNIMSHGSERWFHSGRPKDIEEFLDSASKIGFEPIEVVTEPAGVADPRKLRHLAVLRRCA
jgi:hypothetical protein